MKETVEERIKEILVENLGVDEAEISSSTSIRDDLGADSLDVVELVMSVEETFEIAIPDDDIENLQTVQQVVDYVNRKTQAK